MKRSFNISLMFICFFIIWTMLVITVDVRDIGPNNTKVGLSTLNKFIHDSLGVNMTIYTITDWLGLIPLCFVIGFGTLGLAQWIKRKNLLKVDRDLLVLGIYYLIVMGVYLLFEFVVINYRPVLINGNLETSYPSSTTMLVICVMTTVIIQINKRIKKTIIKKCVSYVIYAFIILMIFCRLISGVHWFTDIVGGMLLSIGLFMLYRSFSILLFKSIEN